MSEKLARGDFSPHVGAAFRVDMGDEGQMELELVEVVDRRSGREAVDGPASFSLEFRGAADAVLAQRTYRLTHPERGDLDLFLVPVGPDTHGMRYESLFNYDAV